MPGPIIVRGDARRLPLPDATVDLIITSPPYYALRSYTDNSGEHYSGQIGSEPTPAEYIAALIDCTREWVRVLKPSGSIFVNLGDKYAGGGMGGHGGGRLNGRVGQGALESGYARPKDAGVRDKSLMGLPWRYALACIDQLSLILRAEIIWSKPSGLPESVTDRVRRSHEQWFHFTRMPRYYSAVDEIREAHTGHAGDDLGKPNVSGKGLTHRSFSRNTALFNPLGKLPGSVWSIPSQPLTVPPSLGVDHFAAFPMEWPRRIIQGWSPPGICVVCGEGRRPVSDSMLQRINETTNAKSAAGERLHPANRTQHATVVARKLTTITGYVCACPEPTAPTRPSVILDPFGGTGTVALIASTLSRTGISVDMSNDYSRLAAWRCHDPAERAKAMQVDKPPAVIDGQGELFG